MDATYKALVDATRSVLDADKTLHVIQRILRSAQSLLNAEASSVFLVNRRKRCLEMVASTNLPQRIVSTIRFPIGDGVAGWVAQHNESVMLENLTSDPRYYSDVAKKTGFITRGYLCVPLSVNGVAIGTVQVLNQTSGSAFTRRDRELLEGFAILAALAIEKNRLHGIELEKKRMQAELEVAQTFQRSLLPRIFDPPKPWRMAAFYKPARHISGDLYDAMPMPRGFLIALGDVAGKGPGAAIWMSGFSNLLRFMVDEGRDPIENLPELDRHFHHQMPIDSFITVFLASLEGDRLRYTSAGHNPMLLMLEDGTAQWLGATGLPLSLLPHVAREILTVEFPPGARLVLFSDGIPEAMNRDGEMYEEQRLESLVRHNRNRAPETIVKNLVASVKRFSQGTEQSDDLTVLVVARESELASLDTAASNGGEAKKKSARKAASPA